MKTNAEIINDAYNSAVEIIKYSDLQFQKNRYNTIVEDLNTLKRMALRKQTDAKDML